MYNCVPLTTTDAKNNLSLHVYTIIIIQELFTYIPYISLTLWDNVQ